MKNFSLGAHTTLLLALLFLVLIMPGKSHRLAPHRYISVSSHGRATYEGDQGHYIHPKDGGKEEVGMELDTSGSTLPDCSHACGPCSPCKRVMVSFNCSSLAESCPVVYRCMCKGKYYHVPSQ